MADLALQFRQTFGRDCILDIFCFRRYGHNEADEPSFTHPAHVPDDRQTPRRRYTLWPAMRSEDVASEQEQTTFAQEYMNSLRRPCPGQDPPSR